MKKRNISGKLNLNKQTVVDLNEGQMKAVKGGVVSAPCDSVDPMLCWSAIPNTDCGFCLTYWTCYKCSGDTI